MNDRYVLDTNVALYLLSGRSPSSRPDGSNSIENSGDSIEDYGY